MIISNAPSERVPRHRLIGNLIDLGEYDQAETEIRVFDNDFRLDAPVTKYKIRLKISRASLTPGLMIEDRLSILSDTKAIAIRAIGKYQDNPHILSTYCEVGFALYKLTGDKSTITDALDKLREAEGRTPDPTITGIIRRIEKRLSSNLIDPTLFEDAASSR